MTEPQVVDLMALARQATVAKDSTAPSFWLNLAEQRSHDPSAIKEAATNLIDLKAFSEAESILRQAMENLPDEPGLLIDFARCAALQQQPAEEIARLALLRQRFPNHAVGYINGIRAARRTNSHVEAEALAEQGLARCGNHHRLLIESAICADLRSEWPEAVRRWRLVDQHGPMDGRAFYGLGVALIRNGQIDEGEAELWKGLAKFPRDLDVKVALAEAATARECWGEAVAIWQKLLEENPRNQRLIDGLGVATWRYQVQKETFGEFHDDTQVQVADVGQVLDEELRQLMLRFESLGEDCEFGLVQRHYGAEPLSMLRWCSTHPGTLTPGLGRRFEGVGELQNIELDLGKPEIMVNEKSSGIRFHTFIQRSPNLDLEDFSRRQAKHLAQLRRRFLDRLDDGEKIYVYKMLKIYSLDIIEAIYAGIQRYSSAPLLVISRADTENPPGSLRHLHDGLYHGYVDRFGLDRGSVWTISFDLWVKLCRDVIHAAGSR